MTIFTDLQELSDYFRYVDNTWQDKNGDSVLDFTSNNYLVLDGGITNGLNVNGGVGIDTYLITDELVNNFTIVDGAGKNKIVFDNNVIIKSINSDADDYEVTIYTENFAEVSFTIMAASTFEFYVPSIQEAVYTAAEFVATFNDNETLEFEAITDEIDLAEDANGTQNPVDIVTVQITDLDVNVAYSIVSAQLFNNNNVLDQNSDISDSFNINSTTGKVTYIGDGSDLVADTADEVRIKVRADGIEDSSLYGTQIVGVSIEGVAVANNGPLEFVPITEGINLAEDANGSQNPVDIVTVQITNPNLKITYSIDFAQLFKEGTVLDQNADISKSFSINSTTGAVTYTGDGTDLDAETADEVRIQVRADGLGNSPHFDTLPFSVSIVSADNTPPMFGNAPAGLTLSDSAQDYGNFEVDVSATDAESQVTYSFTAVNNATPAVDLKDFFDIDSDGKLTFTGDASNLDASLANEITIVITAESDGGTATQTVTIAVTAGGGNNVAPVFNTIDTKLSITDDIDGSGEGNAVLVTTVTAEDSNSVDKVTYRILSANLFEENIEGDDIHTSFTINDTTGEISYIGDSTVLDAATADQFRIVVEAADDGVPSLSTEATVTVSITEPSAKINLAPVFETIPTGHIEENTNKSLEPPIVATVKATDSNIGDVITYSIVSAMLSHENNEVVALPIITGFDIDSTTGTITYSGTGDGLDAEYADEVQIVVRATDNDESDPLFGEATVKVTIGDVADVFTDIVYGETVLVEGETYTLTTDHIDFIDDKSVLASEITYTVKKIPEGASLQKLTTEDDPATPNTDESVYTPIAVDDTFTAEDVESGKIILIVSENIVDFDGFSLTASNEDEEISAEVQFVAKIAREHKFANDADKFADGTVDLSTIENSDFSYTVDAGNGNDIITDGAGDDNIHGGLGNDVINLTGGGKNTITYRFDAKDSSAYDGGDQIDSFKIGEDTLAFEIANTDIASLDDFYVYARGQDGIFGNKDDNLVVSFKYEVDDNDTPENSSDDFVSITGLNFHFSDVNVYSHTRVSKSYFALNFEKGIEATDFKNAVEIRDKQNNVDINVDIGSRSIKDLSVLPNILGEDGISFTAVNASLSSTSGAQNENANVNSAIDLATITVPTGNINDYNNVDIEHDSSVLADGVVTIVGDKLQIAAGSNISVDGNHTVNIDIALQHEDDPALYLSYELTINDMV